MSKILSIIAASVILLATACTDTDAPGQVTEVQKRAVLPILGERDFTEAGDTIFHTVPDFRFVNQDGDTISNETFAGKAYVADFFFIHCPTICPKVSQQMLRIHDVFKNEQDLMLLAHTVNPKRDTVAALKNYAEKLEVGAPKWHFVTGDRGEIYDIADDYFSVAIENPDAPGGFDHSGRIILVDKDRQVRSFANGTDPEEVARLIEDIKTLLNEDVKG